MPNSNGETLKYRVERLEQGYDKLDGKVDLILTNHLPHIQQTMIEIKTRMNVLTIFNVGAIILALIVSKYLG